MAAEHQVAFLSLYGTDVSDSVPIYLKSGLERSGISVLKRDDKGSEDLRTVLNMIRESSFVLVIFSDCFANSSECLDELVLVKKRRDIGKLRMIPIYYKVEPIDVTHVQGSFGTNLLRKEAEEHKNAMGNGIEALMRTKVRLRNWREALKSVKATREFVYGEDNNFIENITKQAYAKDDQSIGNHLAMSQRTVQQRMEDLVSLLRKMGLGFGGNFSSESNSIHKLSEQCKEQLSKLISEETKKKEGANPIPVFEKSLIAYKQVFINFHSPDVRRTILPYLVGALRKDGINVVEDDEMALTQTLSSVDFSKIIKDSAIALVVFSKHYASSTWCLDELRVIKKYMDKGMMKVIPIYYKVKPSDVMRQTGVFGDSFRGLREHTDEARFLAWQEALQSVVQIMGLVCSERNSRTEAEFIKAIVEAVKSLLTYLPSES